MWESVTLYIESNVPLFPCLVNKNIQCTASCRVADAKRSSRAVEFMRCVTCSSFPWVMSSDCYHRNSQNRYVHVDNVLNISRYMQVCSCIIIGMNRLALCHPHQFRLARGKWHASCYMYHLVHGAVHVCKCTCSHVHTCTCTCACIQVHDIVWRRSYLRLVLFWYECTYLVPGLAF